LKNLIIHVVSWSTIGLAYFMVTHQEKYKWGKNVSKNVIIMSTIDMVGKIVGWMMIEMTDLKIASITSFLITAIGAFCMSTDPS
jgi:hypothetical protein